MRARKFHPSRDTFALDLTVHKFMTEFKSGSVPCLFVSDAHPVPLIIFH
jgi:hypothetical protein